MKPHKHAALIKRWAEDTDLVILVKCSDEVWRRSIYQDCPSWDSDTEHYLTVEDHVEVVLHWINGGEVEMYSNVKERWETVSLEHKPSFSPDFEYRIKPTFEPEEGAWYLVYIDLTSAWTVVQYVDGGFYDESDKRFPKDYLEIKNKIILEDL